MNQEGQSDPMEWDEYGTPGIASLSSLRRALPAAHLLAHVPLDVERRPALAEPQRLRHERGRLRAHAAHGRHRDGAGEGWQRLNRVGGVLQKLWHLLECGAIAAERASV